MFSFTVELFIAIIFIIAARLISARKQDIAARGRSKEALPLLTAFQYGCYLASSLFAVFALLFTSMVWVPAGQFATFTRIYLGQSLPPGRLVAHDGELGPQARVTYSRLPY